METAARNRVEPGDQRLRDLYLKRASRFLQQAVLTLPREIIEHALIANDDGVSVLEIASRPETIEIAEKGDPLAEARVRGREIARKLMLMESGCGTIKTAMEALDISKQAVEKRRRKGNLIAID